MSINQFMQSMSISKIKYLYLITVCVAGFSCSGQNKTLTGSYTNEYCSPFHKIFRIGAVKNTIHLLLNEDSSFVYTTCANRSKGYWQKSHDSLLLFCTENKLILNGDSVSCGYRPMTLWISGNKLTEKISGNQITKKFGGDIITCLVKTTQ